MYISGWRGKKSDIVNSRLHIWIFFPNGYVPNLHFSLRFYSNLKHNFLESYDKIRIGILKKVSTN